MVERQQIGRIRNEYIREIMNKKNNSCNCLSSYGHELRRDEIHVTKRVLNINVDGLREEVDQIKDEWTL